MALLTRPRSIPLSAPPPPRRKIAKPQPFVSEDLTRVWSIGPSMYIKGELCGDVDVSIDGGFDGKITLQNNQLFTGACSRIHADVFARTVVLRGRVVGNVTAQHRITVARTASVQGEIRAPRVTLVEGCTVQGRIIQQPLG